MTPAGSWIVPQPEPLPLPAPVWLLWGLLMLTFVLHTLAMNALVGGSVIAAHARMRTSGHGRAFVSRFVRMAPVLIAATVSLGVAPLLFVQALYGRLFFVSSILMAWPWLAVVAALILVYYGAHVMAYRDRAAHSTPLWLQMGTVVLLAAIAFAYTTNMSLMLRADRFGAMYAADAGGLHLNIEDPTFWARWLHMMLGAIAVAGLIVAIGGALRATSEPEAAEWLWRTGIEWSAGATVANLAAGGWWMLALPISALERLATPGWGGALFVTSVAAGVFTCMLLLILMSREPSVRLAWTAGVAMLVTVVTMIFVRDQVRAAALDRMGFAQVQWVVPQWGPIALFVLLLVVALALVGWMTIALRRAYAEGPA